MDTQTAGHRFQRLVDIMRTLRGPQGCPWDREQTLETLRAFVIEETYELVDAIDTGDREALREELGDVLFEAVFLAEIAMSEGAFSVADALQSIIDKLIRRHPHVFTADGRPLPETGGLTSRQVVEKWEDLKARERADAGQPQKSALSGVPRAMPSLLRAYELSARAAAVGFDWARAEDVLDKIDEEAAELRAAVTTHGKTSAVAEEELGDLFFALANLTRKLGLEPEAALKKANDKFQRRFEDMERAAGANGQQLKQLTLGELEALWSSAKDNTRITKATKTNG